MPYLLLRPVLSTLLLTGLLFSLSSSPSHAQPAQPISMRELSRQGRNIQTWARSGNLTAEQQSIADQYFKNYYFRAMVKSDAEALEKLGERRDDLFDRYLEKAQPAFQEWLTNEAYSFFVRAVDPRVNLPPAIKYNAALVLGRLDDQYAQRNGPAARPSDRANRILCLIAQRSAERQQFPSYLHVAALVGLERHARNVKGLSNDAKQRTAKALLATADQSTYQPGVDREAQGWLKLKAAEGIASFGVVGPEGSFVKAISRIVSDQTVDLPTRLGTAQLFEKITLDGAPQPAVQQMVGAMKGLSCDLAKEQSDAVQLMRDSLQNRGLYASKLRDSSRFRMDETTGWGFERRGIIADMDLLATGLKSLQAIAGDDAAGLKSIEDSIRTVISTAAEKNTDFTLMDKLDEFSDKVTQIAGCKAEPAAGEAAEEEPLEELAELPAAGE